MHNRSNLQNDRAAIENREQQLHHDRLELLK
jgi:hypothetical protein